MDDYDGGAEGSGPGTDPNPPEREWVTEDELPPNQMPGHMARGYVEGFCVGEPWNTLAQQNSAGQIVAATTDILPQHPEKVLAVTRRWLEENQALPVSLIP